MKKIMITGATGNLGQLALQFLLQKAPAASLSAIARDPSKLDSYKKQGVHVIRADYEDKESLLKAFQSVDLLYFISGSDVERRYQQHQHIVDAARQAGIKQVVYTSFQRKSESTDSPIAPVAGTHLQTEKWLKESGLSYTILKHALYSEVIPMFARPDVIEKGVIYLPAGGGKVSFASRSDMAQAAAHILTTSGHENKTYEFSGPVSYSFGDIAKILGDLSGKRIIYVSPSAEEFRNTLSGAGVPAAVIEVAVIFGEGIKQGEFDFPDPTLENMLGRKVQPVENFLKTVYA